MSAFAISVDNGTSLVWHGNNPSRGINVHKNVLASPDPSSSWKLVLEKPTMHDIMTAAEHFEVMDFVVRFYPLVYALKFEQQSSKSKPSLALGTIYAFQNWIYK
ncbi:hypothetical protein BGZ97_006892 [Linnemannia gamsii]|uniref:Uncharacterized protein n=1 Tax=Linnemannia gamsii TaxID=64522 RepID=A0A9P6QNK7_9FUNG|nr:hypothetical protein BGZ97_006892 [Linnemannia gamsii]